MKTGWNFRIGKIGFCDVFPQLKFVISGGARFPVRHSFSDGRCASGDADAQERVPPGVHFSIPKVVLMMARCSLFFVLFCSSCATKPTATSPVGDTQVRDRLEAGYTAWANQSVPEAARNFDKALQRAMVINSPSDIAQSAYNLAICHLALGDYSKSELLLLEAEDAYLREGDVPADVYILEVRLALVQGNYEKAVGVIDKLELDEKPSLKVSFQVLLLKAQMALQQGHVEDCEAVLEEAAKFSLSDAPLLTAQYLVLHADVLKQKEMYSDAAATYKQAAEKFKTAGDYRSMAEALQQAGNLALSAGDDTMAVECLYQSARSFYAQGDKPMALESLRGGMDAVKDSDTEATYGPLMADLFSKMSKETANKK